MSRCSEDWRTPLRATLPNPHSTEEPVIVEDLVETRTRRLAVLHPQDAPVPDPHRTGQTGRSLTCTPLTCGVTAQVSASGTGWTSALGAPTPSA